MNLAIASDDGGLLLPNAGSRIVEAGENTEKISNQVSGNNGFSISVDGERIAGDKLPVDNARQNDIDLEKVDIQVKFDGLDVKPVLNVSTVDLRSSYQEGELVRFLATANYPAWISRSELRIFANDTIGSSKPVAVVDVDPLGQAVWQMDERGNGDFSYVLRVYDERGRFDETLPLGLSRTSSAFPTHATIPVDGIVSPGNGDDRTSVRNIPVFGGAVTVYGRNVPAGYKVTALGENIPIDANASFVIQRILPPGDHAVEVGVSRYKNDGLAFVRDINIPTNEWFYVGLADLTLGKRFGSSALTPVGPGEYSRYYSKGRLAFYLKGKIKGQYILTAAADTGEDELDKILKGMDSKDPRQLLRRIDPDDYYPVYGDDSTSIEDAPTQGKFYVRLERGDSYVMWGNYKATINGSEFARNERALYGAKLLLRSENVTAYGDRIAQVEAYGSQPGTLPQRDALRGTGGSVYFLSRQDITRGSETINIEIRDSVSGIVKSRKQLRVSEDYEIDYIQGVVILKKPLGSTASDGSVVKNGALGNDEVRLVAQYEYTPTVGQVDGYSYGGRAQAWVGNNLRVGLTAMNEETGLADQTILSADLHIRLAENSFIEAEIAQSEGPGFGSTNSINGGLTITGNGSVGAVNRKAKAYRVRGEIDISDFDPTQKGKVGAYYEKREAGFSSPGYNTTIEQRVWGAFANVQVNEDLRYRFGYEDFQDQAGKLKREGDGEVEFTLTPDWKLALGAKHTELASPTVANQNGRRTDIGARLTYQPDDDNQIYVFGQKTVARKGNIARNDRLGFGVETRLSEKLTVNGEVSYGTSGWGGLAGLNYEPTADDQYYIGYRLDPDRAINSSTLLNGLDLGGIVIGAKRRYSDTLSSYAENNFDRFGRRQSLTSTYGVIYTPDALWTLNGSAEFGDIQDPNGEEITRSAVSASIAYNDSEAISWRILGEARFEDSTDQAKDRNTYLVSAGASIKVDEDWRFLASLDAAISASDQNSFLDGDYIEASIGYAYRPVDNDRLNALFKYTYLYDLPGPDQVSVSGLKLGPAQRSHVLSADVTFDVNRFLTIGAKYGLRIGEVSETRAADNFAKSSAQLGILRADLHVIKNWDLMLEGRVLSTPEIDTTQFGVVAAIYRQFGNNLKVGVGYNFGRFSDDVSDLTYDDGGVFLNIIGKF
ncbi:MAG: porin [Rhizobiaceae bacterium]|nr:porin [Rhizobiaceae bacterium]